MPPRFSPLIAEVFAAFVPRRPLQARMTPAILTAIGGGALLAIGA